MIDIVAAQNDPLFHQLTPDFQQAFLTQAQALNSQKFSNIVDQSGVQQQSPTPPQTTVPLPQSQPIQPQDQQQQAQNPVQNPEIEKFNDQQIQQISNANQPMSNVSTGINEPVHPLSNYGFVEGLNLSTSPQMDLVKGLDPTTRLYRSFIDGVTFGTTTFQKNNPPVTPVDKITDGIGNMTGSLLGMLGIGTVFKAVGVTGQLTGKLMQAFRYNLQLGKTLASAGEMGTILGSDSAIRTAVDQFHNNKLDVGQIIKIVALNTLTGMGLGAIGQIPSRILQVMSASGIGTVSSLANGNDLRHAGMDGIGMGLFQFLSTPGIDRQLRLTAYNDSIKAYSDALQKANNIDPASAKVTAKNIIDDALEKAGINDISKTQPSQFYDFMNELNRRTDQTVNDYGKPQELPEQTPEMKQEAKQPPESVTTEPKSMDSFQPPVEGESATSDIIPKEPETPPPSTIMGNAGNVQPEAGKGALNADIPASIITDPAKVQEIRNSIAEGQLILRSGTFNGRTLSTPELLSVRRSVENALAKIGESKLNNGKGYTITDVTPKGYGIEEPNPDRAELQRLQRWKQQQTQPKVQNQTKEINTPHGWILDQGGLKYGSMRPNGYALSVPEYAKTYKTDIRNTGHEQSYDVLRHEAFNQGLINRDTNDAFHEWRTANKPLREHEETTQEDEAYGNIPARELNIGDSYTSKGEKFTVIKKNENGITVKDGVRETYKLYEGVSLDEGTLNQEPKKSVLEQESNVPRETPKEDKTITARPITDKGTQEHPNAIEQKIPNSILSQKEISKIAQTSDNMGYKISLSDKKEMFSDIINNLRQRGIKSIDAYHITNADENILKKEGINGSELNYIGGTNGNLREKSTYIFLDPDDIVKGQDFIKTKQEGNPVVHIKIPIEEIHRLNWDSNFNLTAGTYSSERFVGNIPKEWIQSVYKNKEDKTTGAQLELGAKNGVDNFGRGEKGEQELKFNPFEGVQEMNTGIALKNILELPDLKDAGNTIREVTEEFKKTVSPATMPKESAEGGRIFREQLAKYARLNDKMEKGLEKASKIFDKLPDEKNYDIINKAEKGQYYDLNMEYGKDIHDIIKSLQDTLNAEYKTINELKGKNPEGIEHYFPHGIYIEGPTIKKPKSGVEVVAKGPLEGSKGFTKERSFPTLDDALKAGYIPITSNPVTMAEIKLVEMRKYHMAHETLKILKDEGLAKYVRIGGEVPEGWQQLDDKISTVYKSPEIPIKDYHGEKTIPEEPRKVNAGGMVISGHYYVDPNVARIINNYLSPGLSKFKAFQFMRQAGNFLNMAQLGLSAFHLGFTSIDAMVSKLAISIQYLMSGKPLRFLQNAIQVPLMPVKNIIEGDKLLKAWYGANLKPEIGPPTVYQHIADMMQSGGGRARMDRFYANKMTQTIGELFKQGKIFQGIFALPYKIIEIASKPIMEYIVPRQKMGVFADMMKFAIESKPNMTNEEMRAEAQKAWDSVDNRMGQLVYDNIFWNKTIKDLLMANVRSVGWNIGTIREIGGGIIDTAKIFTKQEKNEAGEKQSKFTYRMAYIIALPILAGIMGAIYQYLRTGKGPTELKDYFFPKTGKIDRNGNPDRDSLPTYMKDLYHYSQNPLQVIANKVNPVDGMILQMLANKDFYGVEIRHKDDPIVKQMNEVIQYALKQMIPFGIRNMQKTSSKDLMGRVLPFVGITPAPYDINKTEAEKKADEISRGKMPVGSRTQEEFKRDQLKKSLRSAFLNKEEDAQKNIQNALQNGDISHNDVKTITAPARLNNIATRVKSFSLPEVLAVMKKANPQEQAVLKPLIIQKYQKYLVSGSVTAQQRQEIRQQVFEALK